MITGSSFKDLWPMDSSRFHCFIGRGPFGCIFFLAGLKFNFFFTFQVQGHSSSLCPQCLPDCELTTYTYTTSSVPFRFLPQKIILTTFGRFDHMYVTSDAATREIWTWVPSVILDPSPPCWSGNPLWLSKFNQKFIIYDVLRHHQITNAIHQVMSTYSGTGINTPYTTGLPSPMRRHVFL